MYGNLHTVEFENVSVTAAQDLFALTAADDKPIEIVGIHFGQISDVADAAEEMLRYRVIRGHTTIGSGGAAATARPCNRNSAVANFTARVNDTTIASAGTALNLYSDAFNIRVGCERWFPEGCELGTDQGTGILVVRLLAAPADAVTMSGTVFVREY